MDVPLWKRIKNASSGNTQDDVTEEEIMSLVDEGTEKGVLEDSEAEMIRNIISLDEKDAKDIMTHRKNMVTLDASAPSASVTTNASAATLPHFGFAVAVVIAVSPCL